eukprot:gene15148-biopygen2808
MKKRRQRARQRAKLGVDAVREKRRQYTGAGSQETWRAREREEVSPEETEKPEEADVQEEPEDEGETEGTRCGAFEETSGARAMGEAFT